MIWLRTTKKDPDIHLTQNIPRIQSIRLNLNTRPILNIRQNRPFHRDRQTLHGLPDIDP